MKIKKLIPYVAAFAGALGLASNLYAAESAKVKQAMEYTNWLCFLDTPDNNHNMRCNRKVVVRDEKDPKGLLEITGVKIIHQDKKRQDKSSFIMGRVEYNPATQKYLIMEFHDGDAEKGVDANGTLDEVLAATSDKIHGPHKIFEVQLSNPEVMSTHDKIFDTSLDQFIEKAKEKP